MNDIEKSKAETTKRLIEIHSAVEIGFVKAIRYFNENENDPNEPIKLLEVHEYTIESGIQVLGFGPSSKSGIMWPVHIVEVSPNEYLKVCKGELFLPKSWKTNDDKATS